jgi:multisubunit Na+/H+ antiporter MnhB subunit
MIDKNKIVKLFAATFAIALITSTAAISYLFIKEKENFKWAIAGVITIAMALALFSYTYDFLKNTKDNK